MQKNWYTLTQKQIFDEFQTSLEGLEISQIEGIRRKYGTNKLPESKQDSLFWIFLRQFQSPLIYILLIACVIVFAIKEYTDGSVILFVLFFNSLVGTLQEGKARSALSSLNKLVKTQAVVKREGVEDIIDDTEVVVGDLLLIQEGDKIPADARLVEVNNLKLDESALTGESTTVHKVSEKISGAFLPTSDQKNMIFKGTNVSTGRGMAVVTATGINTVIGAISQAVSKIDTEDPIKHDIKKLSRLIIVTTGLVVSFLFIYGILTGRDVRDMFTTSVSLTVSLIPEGLPVVLTLVLATGVWRMSKKNVLVKKLQAVESLGEATVIALDKTGTITKNEMVVEKIYINDETYDVTGLGYFPTGKVMLNGTELSAKTSETLYMLAGNIITCATAEARFVEDKKTWQILGDPTEAAVSVLSEKLGLKKEIYEKLYNKIGDLPFNYENKYHAGLFKQNNENVISVIGAPEKVLSLSDHVYFDGKFKQMSEQDKQILENILTDFTRQGLRVVAVANKTTKKNSISSDEVVNLNFISFLGMRDAIRPEAAQSIELAKRAGMKIVMITGDHKITAQAVARDVGIFQEGDKILAGSEIELLSDEGLNSIISKVSVFARVSPEHKLRIIQAFREAGEIVAMTGDGVNDAPPLVAADLGVAMGKIGTEVAKEASDIVLLDDNFGNIIQAVEEGRNIFRTIKKVVTYLFSTSLGEVSVIAVSMFMGLPLPIIASQIIWLNFITDGFLTVAIAMEPKELGLLTRQSRIRKKSFVDGIALQRMLVMALPMTIGSVWLFTNYMDGDYVKASTMALTVMAMFQWFNAWNCRSEKKSIFSRNLFSNIYLISATLIVIILQLFAVYHPFLQKVLHTTSINFAEWMWIALISLSIILFEEIRKFIHRSVTLEI